MEKLKNVLKFKDFEKNWKAEKATKTKRTDVGHDIIKEEFDEDGVIDRTDENPISEAQLSEAEGAIEILARVLNLTKKTVVDVLEDGLQLDNTIGFEKEDIEKFKYFFDEMKATFGYEGEDPDMLRVRPPSDFHG